MFRHVVLLRWKADASDADIAGVLDGLAGLPSAIPELVAYDIGPDAGMAEGNFDLSIVADFATAEDYLVYRDHPVHRRVIDERITPILAGRAAVQHQLRD